MTHRPPSTVSIVISCFNYERYVGLAVASALAQTWPLLEVIVVDDGSTDGSAAVLAGFGARITVIRQANAGQIAATNAGYRASTGEAVLFLDADDLLEPEAIESALQAWTAGCAKAQFELELIDSDGDRLGRRFCNYVQPYGATEIAHEFASEGTSVWPVLSGNLYARAFLAQVMPLTAAMGPDGTLNTIAPLYGSVEVVPQVLGRYRLHASNQSYHGTAAPQIGLRFARQVALRAAEIRLLRQHARRMQVELPDGNLLDRDIVFVNYRLMLVKLGETYEGRATDSACGLWRSGLSVLARRPLPLRLKFAHAVWLTVLLCSPRWLAARWIALRFQRAELLRPLRRARAWLAGMLRPARDMPRPTPRT